MTTPNDSSDKTLEPVDREPNFQGIEQAVLAYWEESSAFEKARAIQKDRPLFRFVDGPITANNPMGVHHAWGRTIKDTFLRYKAMTGHQNRYQNGFDCQGLWVEVQVEKDLGYNGKPDIVAAGLDTFSRACRERVNTFGKVISEQSKRLGQWMDWDDSYYTHSDANITGIWHFLAKCHEQGWLYQGRLPMPWCPRCGTSLSEHEMTGSYREMEHLSVIVQAPFVDDPDLRLLIWTTTPWTLSSNVAAAVHPELDYVEVKDPTSSRRYVLGAAAAKRLTKDFAVLRTFKGSEIAGKSFETFFHEFEVHQGATHSVVPWEDVDEAEGTGIVHIAPGCGREDYELSEKIELRRVMPVDDSGIYLEGFGWQTGRSAMEVADEVADRLEAEGKLFQKELIKHSFPFCWRCKGELIFRLVGEWFISSDEVRAPLREAAATVTWEPEYMQKRMDDWLMNMGDWCISRKRFWGLPLPFYPCDSCEHLNVIGSLAQLKERALDPSAVDALPELHRPWIDEVQIRCDSCEAPVSRVSEVGDCWLDAGIVPFTTLGYFEDPSDWERRYPVEWICEMREQVRLWYYSMLFMSYVIQGRAPYERVLSYERVTAEDGSMFSKTGFMIRFDEAVEKIGADAMRYLFCRQSVANECRFGYALGAISHRRLTSLWNVYSFYVTYALIDRPQVPVPLEGLTLHTTDAWLLTRTAHLVERTRASYEAYDTPSVIREVEEFFEDLSNWYVRVNRRRFWRSGAPDDKQACFNVLYHALEHVIRVLAPIVPFFSESLWQNLVRGQDASAPESVHHASFPEPMPEWLDEGRLRRTKLVRDVVSAALRLRSDAQLRVRQPLASMTVVGGGAEIAPALQEQLELVCGQVNVREVRFAESAEEFEERALALNFKHAGPVLKGAVNAVKKLLTELSGEALEAALAAIDAGQAVTVPGHEGEIPVEVFTVTRRTKATHQVATLDDMAIVLDTQLDDALVREGLVRDVMRNLQVLRKDLDFEITQRIAVEIASPSAVLREALEEHKELVASELLAERFELVDAIAAPQGEWTLQDHALSATVRPV